MSLKGQIGAAVLKGIEAIPAVRAEMERAERRAPVLRVARDAAYSALSDEHAKARVAERLDTDASVIDDALALLGSQRGYCYIEDRAYRLLSAAAAGQEVAPMPPEQAALFAEEAALGRLPIEQAFERLAAIEPGLLDVREQAQGARSAEDARACGLPESLRRSVARLIGGGAVSDHQLLHTNLATSIVYQYMEQLTGNALLGRPGTAYFDSPIKHFVATGVLFDRRRRAP